MLADRTDIEASVAATDEERKVGLYITEVLTGTEGCSFSTGGCCSAGGGASAGATDGIAWGGGTTIGVWSTKECADEGAGGETGTWVVCGMP